ncbi:TolC family protein [Flavimarina sp. Hel_I_48]|uniref:TolC family protein n=1 Tax=Flavimarina sp. Hel_I_48 TaxID=1392488 RepID=UPI000A9DBB2B|nr:TolC family protein [Flavimarina sp. Hel_I_48]
MFFCFFHSYAQDIKTLTLDDAVHLALEKSDDARISEIRVLTAQNELQTIKNGQYPEVSVSGQYQYLTNANVEFNLLPRSTTLEGEDAQPATTPQINQLLLGQASISMPLFSGFKLKNAVEAGENQLKAATFSAAGDRETIALQTIRQYIALYKAQRTVELLNENLKSAQQRVTDFSAMEENGLLARNDLLKAELQKSNVALTVEQAKKNVTILNYRLVTFLKLPPETIISLNEDNFTILPTFSEIPMQSTRPDLEALDFQKQAAEQNIDVARGDYYPSVALTGGYIALDLRNALTVTNAMNVGVAVSYDLSSIFKNKSKVRTAKSKAEELQYTYDKAADQVNIQIKDAEEEYTLAQKNLVVYSQSEEQAIENYRIVKDKYDNGLQDTNDLLEADVQRLQSKINLANAKADITQRYYELQEAEGNLTNQLNQ